MEYYIEYVFIQEFIVDFLVLYFMGKLLCKNKNIKKLAVAAAIGGLYTVIAYSVPFNFIKNIVVKLVVGELLITIAYNPKKFMEYIKYTLCFYVFLWVGVSIFNVLYSYFRIRAIIISILLGFAVIFVVIVEIKRINANVNYYREVEIYLNGNSVCLKGFVDTGNEAIDLLSNTPVAITELKNIKELFEENIYYEILNACNKGDSGILDFMLFRMDNFNFRLLKYKTINGNQNFMLGILPSKVIVKDGEKCGFVNCVIGISRESVSGKGEFQILLFKEALNI